MLIINSSSGTLVGKQRVLVMTTVVAQGAYVSAPEMNDVGLQPPPPARFDACDEKRTIQPLAMLRCRQKRRLCR